MSAILTSPVIAQEQEPARDGKAAAGAGAGDDRRLPPRHRGAEAERHRHHLRPARDSDHRPDADGAGRRDPGDLVQARAARRQRRRRGGLSHPEARHLPHRLGARLPERPDGARQRDDQLLPDDPHQRLERARDRRPAAGRLRGDGPARDRQAALQGGLSRPPCRGHRRRHRAGDPRRAVGPPGRRLPRPAGQAVRPDDGRRCGPQVADQGRRPGAAADSRARRGAARPRPPEGREAAAHPARQGRRLRPGRRRHPRPGREDRHPLPADVDGQGPPARHARALGVGGALARARRSRRRDADRRPPQLAAVARQGQDLGAPTRAPSSSSRSTSRRPRSTATWRSPRR